MTWNTRPWTLGALAGLSLIACAETSTEEQAASAQAPISQEAPLPKRHHRMDPARLVEKFDANADGKLEVSELPEHKRERLAAADADKDGVLSIEEIEKHRPMMHGKHRKDPAAMFAHLDANENGSLELSELPEHKREKLAAADADKDGALSREELEAHFAARRSGGPGAAPR
jgi:Ca2+-binding EF-hand superfamily protein